MRIMVIVNANEQSEAGVLPGEDHFAEMSVFNEQLVKAGVMLAGEGLKPSSAGVRLQFSDEPPTVIDGPFAETKELIAGFWILQVTSLDEAVQWMKRAPMRGQALEIRPIFEASDFAETLTPEAIAAEERLRERVASQQH